MISIGFLFLTTFILGINAACIPSQADLNANLLFGNYHPLFRYFKYLFKIKKSFQQFCNTI